MDEIHELLQERGTVYGEAWKLTGLVMGLLEREFDAFLHLRPEYAYNWVAILCKLIRALQTPGDPDHWKDIIGYATLILHNIEDHELPILIRKED